MKLLTDFFPIILFFAAYEIFDIYVATGVAIAASLLQVGYNRVTKGRVEKMHLITLATVVVFGGLTLLLHDRTFIMWKPTVLYSLFGLLLIASLYVGKKPAIQRLMESQIELPGPIWRRVTLYFALFCIVLAALNLYVANDFFVAQSRLIELTGIRNIDFDKCSALFHGNELMMCNTAHSLENDWVNFKLFGTLGLTVVFSFVLVFYLARHIPDEKIEHEES
jgi:intracellular septation protein